MQNKNKINQPRHGKPNQRLANERRRRGWTQKQLAEQLDSNPQNISRWERGETSPSPYFIGKLCDLFEKSADELGLISDESEDTAKQDIHQSSQEESPPIISTPLQFQSAHREPPAQRSLMSTVLAIGGVVAILALVGSILLWSEHNNYQQRQSIAMATARAINTLQLMYDHLLLTNPNFKDGFDSPSFWGSSNPQGGSCQYLTSPPDLRVTSTVGGKSHNCLKGKGPVTPGNNFLYIVYLKITGGDGGGLIFGHTLSVGYYYIYIHTDGTYNIGLAGRRYLQPTGSTHYINKQVGRQNVLGAMVINGEIYLFINDHYVDTATTVPSLPTTTNIGVTAISNRPDADVTFYQVKVWQIITTPHL